MAAKNSTSAFAELEELKRRFGNGSAKIMRALRVLSKSKLTDDEELIHFHETLLFFRAYPPSERALKKVEQILKTFAQRVSQLRDTDVDLAPLDDPEVSGIAGTSVTSNFSYAIVSWLVRKHPGQVSIDWDWFEEEDRFGATMPRFIPLLEEEAMVEAHVPYRAWLRAARGRVNEVVWLIQRFEDLKISARAKAELYDALKLHINWQFGVRPSRTEMRLPVRRVFFHREPLIPRREISLAAELSSPQLSVEKVSTAIGEKIIDMARETSAVRYRELHGFTYGDPQRVLKANLGRGVEVYVMGVPAQNRLPLRAYHAALILKNGVPVAYFEGLSMFERLESGFNLYYTFREGETAWLYARILRLMHQLLGVTVFSIDPYQVGHENEEGIVSGAFWFYRKLGFRPVRPELMKLTLSEERKMSADQRHRTSARTLRKLAAGHMLFEMPNARRITRGNWDRFQVRNVGLAIERSMTQEFDGNAEKIRAHSIKFVKRTLHLDVDRWSEPQLLAFENLALLLAIAPGVEQWDSNEQQLAARIIQAKAIRDEALYLKLMQKHASLRAAVIELGS